MCLHTIDKKTKEVTEGWKIFRIVDDSLSENTKDIKFFSIFRPHLFETNKWIKDSPNHFIELNKNTKYKTGFHFYLDKEDAEDYLLFLKSETFHKKYKMVKIKVRNVVATGTQVDFKVGVAREIFIEEESCL